MLKTEYSRLFCQYHVSWCPGDLRSQGIRRHGIEDMIRNVNESFIIFKTTQHVKSCDAIWHQGSRSTLVQVMACCLTAPSHYLNHCWLTVSKVQSHSSEGNFTIDTSAVNHWIYLENYLPKISLNLSGANELRVRIRAPSIDTSAINHWIPWKLLI